MFSSLLLSLYMLIASDRNNFWDNDQLSRETQYGLVSGNGVTIFQDERQVNQIWDDLKGKKVLILVHGFNTPEPWTFYHIFRANLENIQSSKVYDAVIGYVWPSYEGDLDYYKTETNVNNLSAKFLAFIEKLSGTVSRVDVMAHSMGNRLVLEALNGKKRDQPLVDSFFLVAPAVDNESIDKDQLYYPAILNCKNAYVLYSRRDDVLKNLYLLVEWDKALGYDGDEYPELLPENVQMIDCTDAISNHAAYLFVPAIYHYLEQVHTGLVPKPFYAKNISIADTGAWRVTNWRNPQPSLKTFLPLKEIISSGFISP